MQLLMGVIEQIFCNQFLLVTHFWASSCNFYISFCSDAGCNAKGTSWHPLTHKSLLKICTPNDSLKCISSLHMLQESFWGRFSFRGVLAAYFYLQRNREVQQALLARPRSKVAVSCCLWRRCIFAWGVVNIKAPFGQPSNPCQMPESRKRAILPLPVTPADEVAPRPLVSRRCQPTGRQWAMPHDNAPPSVIPHQVDHLNLSHQSAS